MGDRGVFYRNGKCLYAIGCGNDTAIAIGLLLERVVLLYQAMVIAVQLLIPLYRTKVGGL